MLPLYLLTNAKGQKMSIELKNGEIVEGVLTNVDNWMNLTLSDVNQRDGSDKSFKLKELYLRGTYIKYINLQDDIIENVKQQIINNNENNNNQNYQRRRHNINSNSGRFNNSGGYRKNQNNRRSYQAGNSRRPYQNGGNTNSNNNNNNSNNNNSAMGGYVQQHIPSQPAQF